MLDVSSLSRQKIGNINASTFICAVRTEVSSLPNLAVCRTIHGANSSDSNVSDIFFSLLFMIIVPQSVLFFQFFLFSFHLKFKIKMNATSTLVNTAQNKTIYCIHGTCASIELSNRNLVQNSESLSSNCQMSCMCLCVHVFLLVFAACMVRVWCYNYRESFLEKDKHTHIYSIDQMP